MSIHKFPNSKPVDQGGQPPDNTDMEARVAKLEGIIPTLATKEDLLRLEVKLHQEINSQTWRIIGAMITFGGLLSAATFFIARNVH
jgi:hypothetical protein